jgi:hypothetical protein
MGTGMQGCVRGAVKFRKCQPGAVGKAGYNHDKPSDSSPGAHWLPAFLLFPPPSVLLPVLYSS